MAEFEAGVWHGYHYAAGILRPNHYKFICLSALEAGVAGWNWYMLVNRDNWYGSPINEWGRRRYELLDVFKKIVDIFNRINVPKLDKITNTSVTFDITHHATGWIDADDPILSRLYEADIDYEFFDVETGKIKKPILFWVGCQWLKRESQGILLRYVEDGGNLVFFKNFPVKDDNFIDFNLLDIKLPETITTSYFKKIELKLGEYTTTLSSSVFNYKSVPGKPIIGTQIKWTDHTQEEMGYLIGLQTGRKFIVGYHQKVGKGSLMVLGVDPTPDLIVKLHKFFGIDIPSRSLTPNVTTALFKGSNCYYLVVVNNGQEGKAAEIVLSKNLFTKKNYQVEDLFKGNSWGVSFGSKGLLSIPLDRKSGTIFKIKV